MSDRTHVAVAMAAVAAGAAASAVARTVAPADLDPGAHLAVTMLRTAIGLSGAYVATLGLLSALGVLLGWRRALRWSMRLGAARLGLAASIGAASLGVAPLTAASPAGATGTAPTSPPSASLTPIEPPVASLVPLADEPDEPAPDDTASIDEPDEPAPGDIASIDDRTWTVEQGDHLWAIAEHEVGDGDDAEIHDYWMRLIELNADRLVVADDPDLILPGQELLLPDR